MKLKACILKPLFFLIFLSPPLFSHICIDVDEFYFKSTSTKGLRISIFDTDTQTYKHIGYHPHKTASSRRVDTTTVEYEGLKISYDYIVTLPENFGLEKYIIRTKGNFILPPQWHQGTDYLSRQENSYNILYKNMTPKEPTIILKKLGTFTKSICTPLFTVKYAEEQKSFNKIVPSNTKKENSDERKQIGEIATTLTMFSFGWFTNFPTQNGSNHGLDGAFLHPSGKFLFLTESKCRDENKTATNYLEDEMSEKIIISKINRKGVSQTTKNFIETFINETPQCVFKAVHRIMESGLSQWAIEPLNQEEHTHLTLSPQSSEKDVITLYQSTTNRAALSQEKALDLFLKALNITPTQAIDILQGKPIQFPVTPLSSSTNQIEVIETPLSPGLPKVPRRLSFSTPESKQSPQIATKVENTFQAVYHKRTIDKNNVSFDIPPYSFNTLQTIVKNLSNNKNKKLSQADIAKYCECSRTPICKLLGVKKGEVDNPKELWDNLVSNLDTLCNEHKFNKRDLFDNE